MKALFGGSSGGSVQSSDNSSQNMSQQQSASGYSALSPALQAAFNPMGAAVGQYTNPNNPGVIQSFTPMGVTAGETGAMNAINGGFAPTQSSVNSDMALQMNPYNDSVISEINRQGQGQYSVLKQAMDNAGTSNSNRSLLGANDIDLSRQNLVGGFLNNQFNTAMNNALTVLPTARATDASNQMGVGAFLRNLQMQTAQAPINALQAGTSMMAPFVQGGTAASQSIGSSSGTSTGNSSQDSQNGIFKSLGF